MFLPYKSDDPESCEEHGSRYSMSNCVFEAAFEVSERLIDFKFNLEYSRQFWKPVIASQSFTKKNGMVLISVCPAESIFQI